MVAPTGSGNSPMSTPRSSRASPASCSGSVALRPACTSSCRWSSTSSTSAWRPSWSTPRCSISGCASIRWIVSSCRRSRPRRARRPTTPLGTAGRGRPRLWWCSAQGIAAWRSVMWTRAPEAPARPRGAKHREELRRSPSRNACSRAATLWPSRKACMRSRSAPSRRRMPGRRSGTTPWWSTASATRSARPWASRLCRPTWCCQRVSLLRRRPRPPPQGPRQPVAPRAAPQASCRRA
mmetsp:Transcript_53043/g.148892  ORF Transcript_53043/g.148892 Transcript_53043/m.148892 type:complete len:237 (-) Transcript_53043:1371-2081(-)